MTDHRVDSVADTIARSCISVRWRLLNRMITNLYDDALRPLGLKVSQLNILVAAAKLGLARHGDICDLLQLDESTLSRNVERMRAKGWLEVVAEGDGRLQPFRLTASGKRILQRAFVPWGIAQRRAQELLGDEGVVLLNNVTTKHSGRLPRQ